MLPQEQEQEESVTLNTSTDSTESTMPKWFKILIKVYALLFILNITSWGSKFLSDLVEYILPPFSTETALPTFLVVGYYSLSAIVLFLSIIYGIGLFRARRWVLPVLSFYLVGLSLVTILTLVFGNYSSAVHAIINLIFTLAVGWGAWLYRATFLGPMRKLWVQIPLFVVLVPIFSFLAIAQVFTDDVEIRDADLLLPQLEVLSEEDNAYFFIPTVDTLSSEEQSSLDLALEYYRTLEQGNEVDIIEVSSVFESLSHIADRFIETSKVQGYQCPLTVNTVYSLESEYCNPSVFRSIASVVALRSYVELAQGNIDTALEHAYASAQLGKLVSAEQPDLIEHFVGLALVKIGLESIGRIENYAGSTLSEDLVLSILHELEQHEFDGSSLENSLKREYLATKETILSIGESRGYLWHRNSTINDFAELARQNIMIAKTNCNDSLEQKIEVLEARLEKERQTPVWWTLIKPNAIGSILKEVLSTALGGVRVRECEINDLNKTIQQRLHDVAESPNKE